MFTKLVLGVELRGGGGGQGCRGVADQLGGGGGGGGCVAVASVVLVGVGVGGGGEVGVARVPVPLGLGQAAAQQRQESLETIISYFLKHFLLAYPNSCPTKNVKCVCY